MWSVEPGFYQRSLIEHFEFQGVLVTAHSVGSYPLLKHSDGTLSWDTPHIEILLNGGCHNGVDYYTGALIKTKQPVQKGRSRELIAWECAGSKQAAPDGYIALAKEKLNSAIVLLKSMDTVFEIGYARVVQGVIIKPRSPLVLNMKRRVMIWV